MSVKMIAAALTVFGAATVVADVAVTGVKVQPRSPWNGLVDVEYTLVCDDPEAEVYVNPVGYDGDRGITLFPTAFTGDAMEGPVKAGKHTLVWDARKDFGYSFSCANFQLKFYAGKHLAPYVIIDLSGGSSATNYPVRFSTKGPDLSSDVCRTTELWMRLIPPGSFIMGSPEGEFGRYIDEDLHRVTFTKPYYMGVFEVTQGQWKKVYGTNSSYFYGSASADSRPVENTPLSEIRGTGDASAQYYPSDMTAIDGGSFISKLRIRTGNGSFDLPTEPQWEYACRAGTLTALNSGHDLDDLVSCGELGRIARYKSNGFNNQPVTYASEHVGTARVGSYLPNALGLYDMSGNVTELCCDYYMANLGNNSVVNPGRLGGYTWWYGYSGYAGTGNIFRVNDWIMVGRGGTWRCPSCQCRSTSRLVYKIIQSGSWSVAPSGTVWDDLGFRLYCDASF